MSKNDVNIYNLLSDVKLKLHDKIYTEDSYIEYLMNLLMNTHVFEKITYNPQDRTFTLILKNTVTIDDLNNTLYKVFLNFLLSFKSKLIDASSSYDILQISKNNLVTSLYNIFKLTDTIALLQI